MAGSRRANSCTLPAHRMADPFCCSNTEWCNRAGVVHVSDFRGNDRWRRYRTHATSSCGNRSGFHRRRHRHGDPGTGAQGFHRRGCLAGGDRLLLCRGLSQDWAGRSHRPECDPSSWWNDIGRRLWLELRRAPCRCRDAVFGRTCCSGLLPHYAVRVQSQRIRSSSGNRIQMRQVPGGMLLPGNSNFVLHVSHRCSTELLCAETGGGGGSCDRASFPELVQSRTCSGPRLISHDAADCLALDAAGVADNARRSEGSKPAAGSHGPRLG
mmetsp:Transcript_53921/g.126471  ORF Transcript_53921/g.126471 Transcript_53921/m.126471 type:complete len:268 (+) Transcript_53921:301-1104(+)